MGKRKNRHCQSKQEVLQRMWQQEQEKHGKPEPALKKQLRTANQIRPAIDRARKQMADKNRRESRNDID